MSHRALAPVDPEADSRLRNRLEVTVLNEQTDLEIDESRWMQLVANVLVDEQIGLGGDNSIEVSLLFVDEATISTLNQQFMGKDGPTDVLSFPIDDDSSPRSGSGPIGFDEDGFPIPPSSDFDRHERRDGRFDNGDPDVDDMPMLLGDLVVCPTYAGKNAAGRKSELHDGTMDDELALLVVHGLLHLLGFDHMNDAEAEEMEAREQVHLAKHHRNGELRSVL